MDDLVLSYEEIYGITRYKRPKEQLRAFKELGIPAQLRKIDNTVCVLRAYLTNPRAAPGAPVANVAPKRKSARR
jgi:hypothetical protein